MFSTATMPRLWSSGARRPPQDEPPLPNRSTFKSALEHIAVTDAFLRGINVFKVTPKGKLEPATLTISRDKFIISVLPRTLKVERSGSSGVGGLKRPSILSRVRSNGQSVGSVGSGSLGNSVEGAEAAFFSSNPQAVVDIGSIDRIQSGQNTLLFEKARQREKKQTMSTRNLNGNGIPLLDDKRSFSLIFRGAKTLDLMVDAGGDREQILYILNSIVTEYGRAKVKVGNEVLLLRYIWNDVDRDDSNTINEKEMGELLNRINFQTKEKNHGVVYQKFAKTLGLSKEQRRAGLTFDQCVTLLHKTKRDTWQVKPVKQLFFDMFGQFMSNNKVRKKVSADSFLNRFLLTVQGEENRTMEDVMLIFARLHELELADVTNNISQPNYISLEQFEAYLLSRGNDIFNPEREKFCKSDMTKPLSEYWINSSHNTYLTGHQLTGLSSVEMYSKALYRGVRCIELDIWDGGKDEYTGNPIPIVYHGHTMVSKILFEDIIKALQVFLVLHPKSYPVILSLENHCSLPYQEVMAAQLKNILADKLYVPEESSLTGPLPSPHQLRGKVVIKGRRPVGATDDYDTDSDAADDELTEIQSVWTEKSSVPGKAPKMMNIAPELAKLTLFHGTKFKTWDDSMGAPTHHMHSFSESRVTSFSKRNQAYKWIQYNQTHISRTFPSGTRIDSSNYSPILAWSVGCQMAALNIQTPDEALLVNDGRFRGNGGVGYVLKPSILMMQDATEPQTTHLEVKILSGSCLPKPGGVSTGDCIDPYVKISLFDCHDGREVESSQTTNIVFKNGFSPIWNFEDSFHFDVKNSCVAVMQWTIWDKKSLGDDEFIASASVPISCMRQGIRSVQLFDQNMTRSGAFDFASLLVLVKFEQCQVEI